MMASRGCMLKELLNSNIYLLQMDVSPADIVALGWRHARLCRVRVSCKLGLSTK